MAKLYKVLATGLNFRTEANTGAEIIAVLPLNHVVEMLSMDLETGWSRVQADVFRVAMQGFVATRFLAPLNESPAPSGAGLGVDADKLSRLAPNGRESIIAPLAVDGNAILANFAINENARRLTQFFAQLAHESGGLRLMEENLNYSAKGLRATFASRFSTDAIAEQYARQSEKIANRAYADKIGNGPESSGDGWRFRGRGLIQLTGRDNYKKYGDLAGVDLIANPEIAEQPVTALKLAAAFWQSKGLNSLADNNQFKTITRRINGGLNGLNDREAYLQRARSIWG